MIFRKRNLATIICLLILLFLKPKFFFSQEKFEGIIASVNSEAITTFDLSERIKLVLKSLNLEVKNVFERTQKKWGRLDILVNNAGTTHRNKPMTEVSEEEFDKIFAVNVKSIFLTAKYAVPLMKKQGNGNILNIASTAGLRPRPAA